MPKRKKPPKELIPVAHPEPLLRPALSRAVDAVRAAVGALIDLADAAAEAVTKKLQERR
jgi:hypothetical protein